MKSFLLDKDGDAVIKDGQVQMIEGNELKAQTIRQVVGTNLGEWFKNKDEGMDFSVILTKRPNYDLIRDAVLSALKQVDESLEITEFNCRKKQRNLEITFTAVDNTGETVTVTV